MATTQEATATQAALTLSLDGDGVAWLIFDRPDSRVNLLTTAVMARLDALLVELEEHVRTGRAKAVVVRSGKPGTFIAGADIGEIASITDAEEGAAKAREGQRIFRRLERLAVPSIAVVDGTCLGGGTELALACAYRLATDRPETRLALPEVRLGIIPGFGGTTRLPRLVGLKSAVELIVTGRSVAARKAERIGLVDALIPPSGLEEVVRRFTWERIDRGRLRAPRRRKFLDRLLEDTAPGRALLLRQARRQVLKETGGHYPAPLAALDTIAASIGVALDEAFEIEARAVGPLVASTVSKNLIHVFTLMEGAKKAAPAAEPRAVERAAVIGAGVMGGGIAQLLADRGVAVRLKDIRPEALATGLRHARDLFERAARKKRISHL